MYLNGENIKPNNNKEAKFLIGKKVEYLCNGDIDHSGRGYFFPRINTIANVVGRQIIFENYDSIYIRDLKEMIIIE